MTATCFAGAKTRQQSHYDHKQTNMAKETHVCVFCDGTHHSNDSNDCIKTTVKFQNHREKPTSLILVNYNNLKSQTSKRLSLVKQLRLFFYLNGTIRCGGRIHNEPLTETARFPYLLPIDPPLTPLAVLDVHETLKHSGVLATVTQIRQTYWDPCIRQYAKKVLHKRIIFRKVSGKPHRETDPPPLPKIGFTEASVRANERIHKWIHGQ
ncbi:unnamed protein product [Mytilus coruscus]|uniref:Integrase zinc-binding domain-containing protein n=1 Tax=Mytilus coruscus TaxID=42192 RepID=A0A6J8C1K1_MYTCO|nr:unnamed protein product [Mytilus coruscus]